MNIGYIKSNSILNNNECQRKLQQLNISKLYIDKQGENVKLRELLKYLRQGDNIVVEDIRHLNKSIGEFTELALNLRHQGINIVCKHQQIDTSSLLWDELSKQLNVFITDPSEQQTGRTSRNIEELDKCFDLVAEGKLTVEEACKQLSIGKSTYYRRWRKVIKVNMQPQEKHPERFKEFESLVEAGKITVTEAARRENMRIIKTFIVACLIATLTLSSSVISFVTQIALSDEQSTWLKENITGTNAGTGEVTGTESWIKKYLTANEDDAAKNDGVPVILGSWSIGDLSGQYYLMKGKNLEGLSKQIGKSMNEGRVTDRVSDMIEELEIHASTGDAAALFSGFMPILNLILGVMVTIITVGMTLSSAVDIAYIAFPVFRNMCEDKKMTGGPGTKKTANGETKLLWVTDDAEYSVKQCSIESGQSPWSLYFKRRIVSYIMLAITLFILMTGNITLITNIAINIVAGIMDVLGGLAA